MRNKYIQPKIRKPTKRKLEKLVASLVDEANRLESLSLIDELTQVYNKRACKRRLKEEAEKTSRDPKYAFCYMQIDVNKFKVLNDNYGHPIGDYILSSLAEIFTKNVRIVDGIYRVGGDEFAIICIGDIKIAEELERRIKERVRTSIFSYRNTTILPVNISAGSSQYTDSLDGMIKEADTKMYEDKRREEDL